MYPSDPQAKVVELKDIPQCDVGSPSPQILAHEYGLLLAYLIQQAPGSALAGPASYAILRFVRPRVHMSGSPNDEVLSGHPLYANGLSCYGRYQALNFHLGSSNSNR